jgi:hypothetical protein
VGVFQKLSGLLRFKNIGSTSKAKTVKLIGKFQPCLMSFTPRVYIEICGITKFLDHSEVWSKVSLVFEDSKHKISEGVMHRYKGPFVEVLTALFSLEASSLNRAETGKLQFLL